MIRIKNLRNEHLTNSYDVRVDRASILGNPYIMKCESMRDEVCDKYEKYFEEQLLDNEQFRKEVFRLVYLYRKYHRLNLFCWCAPKRCHAETIAKFIEKQVKGE